MSAACKCDKKKGTPLCAVCPALAYGATTFPVEHVSLMRDWIKEHASAKTGTCVVCGEQTSDRAQYTARPTWRCGDFDPCASRRNAKRKRPQKG